MLEKWADPIPSPNDIPKKRSLFRNRMFFLSLLTQKIRKFSGGPPNLPSLYPKPPDALSKETRHGGTSLSTTCCLP